MNSVYDFVNQAMCKNMVVPGFNIPYLPMMSPVVRALRDLDCFGLIMVARLEWEKFSAGGAQQIFDEYQCVGDRQYTRLHLDHVPVIDEDGQRVDYKGIIREALELGYDSVMVDGSRLPLAENIDATYSIVQMAHEAGVAVEAELGAVWGHESGPRMSYEQMFASGRGFTDPSEAKQFVEQTGVDWLSVAVGSIHGAISDEFKHEPKVQARLNIEHLQQIHQVTGIPLVLHGGSGIPRPLIMESIRHGIAKINIGTAIRQPYERLMATSIEAAQEAVYEAMVHIIREDLGIAHSASALCEGSAA